MKREKQDREAAGPEWFGNLLKAARKSADFNRRCEEAGTLAWNINQLRELNRSRAFERTSLRQRVSTLAKSSGAPVAPILRWFGLRSLSLLDSDAALARFSKRLGFTATDFMDYLRIAKADAEGLPVPVAGRGAIRKSLDQLPWDRKTLARFQTLKEALDAEYRKP